MTELITELTTEIRERELIKELSTELALEIRERELRTELSKSSSLSFHRAQDGDPRTRELISVRSSATPHGGVAELIAELS